MGRKEYARCVGQGLKGKKLSKEERKLEFCALSKLCSGKAKTREEALTICSQPKLPKIPKVRGVKKGQSCEKEALGLTQCMMDYFEANDTYKKLLNINSVGQEIANALLECKCGQKS